jgi:hypothetical protein
VRAARSWYVAAAVLAVLALGLPWTGSPAGAAHPARIAVVAFLVLGVVGLRTGRDRLLTAAAGAGVAGVLLGGLDPAPGRLALAAAVASLLLAARTSGRRLLGRRQVGSRSG